MSFFFYENDMPYSVSSILKYVEIPLVKKIVVENQDDNSIELMIRLRWEPLNLKQIKFELMLKMKLSFRISLLLIINWLETEVEEIDFLLLKSTGMTLWLFSLLLTLSILNLQHLKKMLNIKNILFGNKSWKINELFDQKNKTWTLVNRLNNQKVVVASVFIKLNKLSLTIKIRNIKLA